MRILIIHCTYQYKGGEDTIVAEDVRLLESHGIVVDTLIFNNSGSTALKLLQLPFNIRSWQLTRQKVKDFKPDLVHIHNLHFAASFSVLYALKSLGVPFVQSLHNFRLVCPSALLFHNGQPFTDSLRQRFPWKAVRQGVYKNSRLLTFWLALSTRLHQMLGTFRLTSRYIVMSDYHRDIFLSAPFPLEKDKLVIKQNFCDPFPDEALHAGDHFLFVGRLSVEKGIDTLLTAFAKGDHRLKIAGDGPLKEEVIKYAAAFPNIEYLGPQPKKEVLSLMSRCTALVFTSTWPEGMPMTIIEAFSTGLPVIASRLGVMEAMIEDGTNGIHFEAGNSADLLDKLQQWGGMSATEKKGYYERTLAVFNKYYTPEKNFQRLLSIYNEALELNGYSIYDPTPS